jgi:hypothetical protein
MNLHEFHTRRLESTVALAETAIDRAQQLLRASGRNGVVRRVNDSLSPALRDALLGKLGELRQSLEALAAEFSLAAHPLDIRQVLDAELSTLWVMFENCRPARMKGFGQAFDPRARVALEAHVEKLLSAVLSLRRLVA